MVGVLSEPDGSGSIERFPVWGEWVVMPDLRGKERIVYDALVLAAEQGEPCPLNLDIEDLCGWDSCSMGAWMISRLEKKGLIRVRRYQRFREVQIVETGKWTARSKSMHADRPHVPRGCGGGSRSPSPTDRKPFKRPGKAGRKC